MYFDRNEPLTTWTLLCPVFFQIIVDLENNGGQKCSTGQKFICTEVTSNKIHTLMSYLVMDEDEEEEGEEFEPKCLIPFINVLALDDHEEEKEEEFEPNPKWLTLFINLLLMDDNKEEEEEEELEPKCLFLFINVLVMDDDKEEEGKDERFKDEEEGKEEFFWELWHIFECVPSSWPQTHEPSAPSNANHQVYLLFIFNQTFF